MTFNVDLDGTVTAPTIDMLLPVMLAAEFQLIVIYPMHEPWLDVGRPSDYEMAQRTGDAA